MQLKVKYIIQPVWLEISQYFKFHLKFYPIEIIMDVNKDLASEIFVAAFW